MKPATRPFILAALFLVLMLGSCSRSEEAESQAASGAEAGSEEAAARRVADQATAPESGGGRSNSASDDAVQMTLTDEGRARARQAVVRPADARDDAFEALRFSAIPVYPRDTGIGFVSGITETSARDRAATRAARMLLNALLDGEVPMDALSSRMGPGGRAALDDLIWLADSFDDARTGRVTAIAGAEVSVPFRLLGDVESATGELIMERLDDGWYTADIQVEVSERDTTFQFDPSAPSPGGGS